MPVWLSALLPLVIKVLSNVWDRFWQNKRTTALGVLGGVTVASVVQYFATELHCDLAQVDTVAFITGLITFLQGAFATDAGKDVQPQNKLITTVAAEQVDKDGNPIP